MHKTLGQLVGCMFPYLITITLLNQIYWTYMISNLLIINSGCKEALKWQLADWWLKYCNVQHQMSHCGLKCFTNFEDVFGLTVHLALASENSFIYISIKLHVFICMPPVTRFIKFTIWFECCQWHPLGKR